MGSCVLVGVTAGAHMLYNWTTSGEPTNSTWVGMDSLQLHAQNYMYISECMPRTECELCVLKTGNHICGHQGRSNFSSPYTSRPASQQCHPFPLVLW